MPAHVTSNGNVHRGQYGQLANRSAVYKLIIGSSRMANPTFQIDYATVKTVIKNKYAVWIAIYAEIESKTREIQHNRPLLIDGLQHLLTAALFARTVSNTSAAMLVAEHGYKVQCKALLRTALESVFALAAIVKDPNMADAFVESGERELKRKVFKSKLWSQHLRAPLAHRFSSETFKKANDIAKSTSAKSISTEEMAKVAGLHDWYLLPTRCLAMRCTGTFTT